MRALVETVIRGRLFQRVVLVGLLLPAAAGAQPGPFPSPEETRAELDAVCRRLSESDNPYLGGAIVPRLEALLAERAAPADRVPILGRLGWELLRLGRLDDAARRLEEGLDEVDRLPPAEASEHRRHLLRTLAMVHLQRAEDQNCLGMRHAASCILPIAPEAVHHHPEEARRAGDLFARALELAPEDVATRWLLALARMLEGRYPEGVPEALRLPEEALRPEAPFPRFLDVAGPLGVAATDLSGGAVMDDFDGDGWLDLVSTSWDPCAPMKAFRNDGRGGFEDVTRAWGLEAQLGGLNLVHADYDGDGDLDLLVLRGAWLGGDGLVRSSLLRNDLAAPAGRFVDVTAAAGLAYPAYPSQTAAWADYDGDGDLDLYVGNESPVSSTRPTELGGRAGRAYPSQLFENQGDGTFLDVARRAGVANQRFAKGVAWGDYDGDGDPDLYISNIGPNRLYRNDGPGPGGVTFTDVAPETGTAEPAGGNFATWFFDYDQDGDLDLWVGRYAAPVEAVLGSYLGVPAAGPEADGSPVVHRNDGDRFTDASAELGLTRPLLPMGANFGDLDNDGFPDVYLGTGVPDFAALMPNVMYRNDGGRRFVDVTFAGGFGQLQKGHGIAFGDFDRDGDQDLFQQLGGAYPYDHAPNALYENPGSDHAWIAVELAGARANRFGVGARVEARVRAGGEVRSVHAVAGSGGSFGGSSLVQELGLGVADELLVLTVAWPGGGPRQRFEALALKRYYRIEEPAVGSAGPGAPTSRKEGSDPP